MTETRNVYPYTHGQWMLANILHRIYLAEQASPVDYAFRNQLVMKAVYHALLNNMPAGVRIDPAEPEWPVAYISLPQGQVSWHIPQFSERWDGHSTEEKYRRSEEFFRDTRWP